MRGAALTDMFPVEGTWDGGQPDHRGTPAHRAQHGVCEMRVDGHERMTGTIDTNKGTIEFVREKREG